MCLDFIIFLIQISHFWSSILIRWDLTKVWPAPPAQGWRGGQTVVRSSSTCGPAWWEFFRYYQHVNHNMTMIMANYLSMCRMRTMSSCSAPNASNFNIATLPSVGQSGQLSTCKISCVNIFVHFGLQWVKIPFFWNCTLKKRYLAQEGIEALRENPCSIPLNR